MLPDPFLPDAVREALAAPLIESPPDPGIPRYCLSCKVAELAPDRRYFCRPCDIQLWGMMYGTERTHPDVRRAAEAAAEAATVEAA